MDALDHKLSTEISEIKTMLISLHKQMQLEPNYQRKSISTEASSQQQLQQLQPVQSSTTSKVRLQ